MSEIARCPKCGGEGQVMTSSSGADIYWRVECVECGFNTRGFGSLRGLAPLGLFGPSDNVPQNSREEAVERWDAASQ